MAYVLFALLLFCASVITHIFYCRKSPKSQLHAKAFIFIAILYLIFYAIGVLVVSQAGMLHAQSLWGAPFKITSGVIFLLLIPVYLSFYVLTQLMSPSKKILLTLAHRGSLSYADILLCIQDGDFIDSRLSHLVSSGVNG